MVLIYTCVRNRNVIEINILLWTQRIEFNSSGERKIQAPDICICDDKREWFIYHCGEIKSEVNINWNYCFWQPLSSVIGVTIVLYSSSQVSAPRTLLSDIFRTQTIIVATNKHNYCVYLLPKSFSGTSGKKTIATLSKTRNVFFCYQIAIFSRSVQRFSIVSGLNQAAFNRVVAGDMKVDLSLTTYVHSHIASKLSLVATKL